MAPFYTYPETRPKSEANCCQIVSRARKRIAAGRPFTALSFAFAGDRIKDIYVVVNPNKLQAIPPP